MFLSLKVYTIGYETDEYGLFKNSIPNHESTISIKVMGIDISINNIKILNINNKKVINKKKIWTKQTIQEHSEGNFL